MDDKAIVWNEFLRYAENSGFNVEVSQAYSPINRQTARLWFAWLEAFKLGQRFPASVI